jgi:hypothetical protein
VQPDNRVKRYDNELVGMLTFDFTTLWLGPRQGPRLLTYTPADEITRARVTRLRDLIDGEGAVTGPVAGDRTQAPALLPVGAR